MDDPRGAMDDLHGANGSARTDGGMRRQNLGGRRMAEA